MTLSPEPAVRVAAMLALAAGVGIWGARLLAPVPPAPPPAFSAPPPAQADLAPVAAWFGAAPDARAVRLTVSGIIATGHRGVAILSVDGGPPRAWSVGDTIQPGLRVIAIDTNEVVLDNGGLEVRAAVPRQVMPAGAGIVRQQ